MSYECTNSSSFITLYTRIIIKNSLIDQINVKSNHQYYINPTCFHMYASLARYKHHQPLVTPALTIASHHHDDPSTHYLHPLDSTTMSKQPPHLITYQLWIRQTLFLRCSRRMSTNKLQFIPNITRRNLSSYKNGINAYVLTLYKYWSNTLVSKSLSRQKAASILLQASKSWRKDSPFGPFKV